MDDVNIIIEDESRSDKDFFQNAEGNEKDANDDKEEKESNYLDQNFIFQGGNFNEDYDVSGSGNTDEIINTVDKKSQVETEDLDSETSETGQKGGFDSSYAESDVLEIESGSGEPDLETVSQATTTEEPVTQTEDTVTDTETPATEAEEQASQTEETEIFLPDGRIEANVQQDTETVETVTENENPLIISTEDTEGEEPTKESTEDAYNEATVTENVSSLYENKEKESTENQEDELSEGTTEYIEIDETETVAPYTEEQNESDTETKTTDADESDTTEEPENNKDVKGKLTNQEHKNVFTLSI